MLQVESLCSLTYTSPRNFDMVGSTGFIPSPYQALQLQVSPVFSKFMASKGEPRFVEDTSQPLMQHRPWTNKSQKNVLKIHDKVNANLKLPIILKTWF
jgi:hypothetical protein